MIVRHIDFMCIIVSLSYAITLNVYATKLYIRGKVIWLNLFVI